LTKLKTLPAAMIAPKARTSFVFMRRIPKIWIAMMVSFLRLRTSYAFWIFGERDRLHLRLYSKCCQLAPFGYSGTNWQ
jgi:hypothetical protein